jgi:hypothetical protein
VSSIEEVQPLQIKAMARHIHVDALMYDRGTGSRRFSLTVDGEEFPWHIAEDGVTTTVTDDGVPTVTITLLAERVTVDHRIEDETRAGKREATR